jgi:hypothetical protein
VAERGAPGLPARPRHMQRLQARSNQDKSCRALIVNQGSFMHRPFNHYRGYEPTTQVTHII